MLVAIDSASQQAGVALYDGRAVRAELLWQAGRHHTEMLAPALQELLARAHVQVADLSAVAVSLGPGSFTGLRIGLALAKGLVAARGLPLLGVPTLDITVYPHLRGTNQVCGILQLGRGRLAYAFYRPEDAFAAPAALHVSRHQRGTVADLVAAVDEATYFVGELLQAERDTLAARLGRAAILAPPALSVRRPAALAEIAWARLQRGERDDPGALAPLYGDNPGGDGQSTV